MGRPLFILEDDLISSVCFGFSDGDTRSMFVDAFEDGRLEMQKSVQQRMRSHPEMKPYADDTTVQLYGGDFVVVLPEDAEDRLLAIEYGDGEHRPQPVLRPAVQEAASVVGKAITNGLALS